MTICLNNLEGINSFDDIKGEFNGKNNIECGIKILKIKYELYKNGVKESWSYQNDNEFREICDTCIEKDIKYEEYVGWDAALKGYHGWGCNPLNADTDYVEHINVIHQSLFYSLSSDL